MARARTKVPKVRASRKAKAQIMGQRVGTKARDMRWQAPDGQIWASRFEYSVFRTLQEKGYNVRKTGPDDSMGYSDPALNAECQKCGSHECVVRRRYTPDLLVGARGASLEQLGGTVRDGAANAAGYYIEAKGYLRSERRAMLRAFRKAWPRLDLRLVVQRDYKVTSKLTITEWARKFLKCEVHVWDGDLPKTWRI